MRGFHDLNRVTHQEVRNAVESAGLEIIHEERGRQTDALTALLDQHRPNLNLIGIDESLLFEEWLLLVARKTGWPRGQQMVFPSMIIYRRFASAPCRADRMSHRWFASF